MTGQQNDPGIRCTSSARSRTSSAAGSSNACGPDRRGARTQGKRPGRQTYDIASKRFEAVDNLSLRVAATALGVSRSVVHRWRLSRKPLIEARNRGYFLRHSDGRGVTAPVTQAFGFGTNGGPPQWTCAFCLCNLLVDVETTLERIARLPTPQPNGQ